MKKTKLQLINNINSHISTMEKVFDENNDCLTKIILYFLNLGYAIGYAKSLKQITNIEPYDSDELETISNLNLTQRIVETKKKLVYFLKNSNMDIEPKMMEFNIEISS